MTEGTGIAASFVLAKHVDIPSGVRLVGISRRGRADVVMRLDRPRIDNAKENKK